MRRFSSASRVRSSPSGTSPSISSRTPASSDWRHRARHAGPGGPGAADIPRQRKRGHRAGHRMSSPSGATVGLAAVAVSGMGFVGFAGAASAGPVCASTVRLNSTYGYTYLTATGEVIGLSGKGCSTSSHTVKVTFVPLYGPSSTGPGDLLSVSLKPSCPAAAPKTAVSPSRRAGRPV